MIVAELNPQLWWYVSRSAGFVSWAAVTLSVLWGLALSIKLMGKTATPAWLLDVHRFLGAFSVIFIGVHLIGLVGDDYVYFSWAELFVPMASTWQPGAVAWGIVGFYFLIAVQITSLVMNRIPRKLWRWVHFTSFAVYVTATVHAIESGTDVTNPIYRWTALASVQLVFFMLGVRLVTTRRLKRSLRKAAVATGSAGSSGGSPVSADATRVERLAALRERREKAAAGSDDVSVSLRENSGMHY
jgi:predicted ferric reductase